MTFTIIEMLGMIFSMTGAFFMSRSVLKHPKTMFYSGMAFMTANLLMLILAIHEGMIPLLVQMILFITSASMIILSNAENKDLAKKTILAALFFTAIIAFLVKGNSFVFTTIPPIEVFAAVTAITGSFLLKSKNESIKIYAFFLFLIADIAYAWIGYERGLYFFMTQAIFFWYTSVMGIKNSFETKKVLASA